MYRNSILLLTMAPLTMTACFSSSEPSERDIKSAMLQQIAAHYELTAGSLLANDFDLTVNHIKKIGCTKSPDEGGYSCDVDMDVDVSLPFAGVVKRKGVESISLIETDDGWKIKGF